MNASARRLRVTAHPSIYTQFPKTDRPLSRWADAIDAVCDRDGPFTIEGLKTNYQVTARLLRLMHACGFLCRTEMGRTLIYWWRADG